MREKVILVDKNDKEIGVEDKMKAHQNGGKLHRAFSIFVFNPSGELLLQRRAKTKYHSPGLWSNTCCSHPRPKEKLMDAAHRRLKEEMGFDCKLKKGPPFIYETKLENNLWEKELDHLIVGEFKGNPEPNSEEVGEWKWMDMGDLSDSIQKDPQKYTYWLKAILKKGPLP